MTYRFTKNKRTKIDFSIMILILLLPFLYFTYNIVPDGQKWTTNWFSIDAGLHKDVDYFLWHIYNKVFTFSILCIWFLTCEFKWKYILLIPIFLEINKFVIVVNSLGINQEDEIVYFIYEIIPYSIPLFLFLIWFDRILGYGSSEKSANALLNEEINNELIKLTNFDMKIYESVKNDLTQLENQKIELTKKDYLTKLISLRDRLNQI